jgi:hypothetical protein
MRVLCYTVRHCLKNKRENKGGRKVEVEEGREGRKE